MASLDFIPTIEEDQVVEKEESESEDEVRESKELLLVVAMTNFDTT